MASLGKTKFPTQMSTECDAEPNTPIRIDKMSFGETFAVSPNETISVAPSMDAYPGSLDMSSERPRRPGEQRRPTGLSLSVNDKLVNEKLGDLSLEDSVDSSYGSMTPSTQFCSSMPSDSWESELQNYSDMMPPKIKVGYIDCLILYAEVDREDAEKFKIHLIQDIKLPKHGPVIAKLYDCEDFTALAGGQIRHLDETVQRSTYIFMYLTKNFVSDKWMEFSSESCLMESIYNSEKQWCVVPVYTQKRNNGLFRVPMGLNSLKGINYYNNDQFYRNGVARLIGDKVHVRVNANLRHKMEQKKWLEQFKREQLHLKKRQQEVQYEEERKTRELEMWLRRQIQKVIDEMGTEMHHSSSESYLPSAQSSFHSPHQDSLKQICQQNPAVVEYLEELRYGNKMGRQGYYTEKQMRVIQNLPSHPSGFVPSVPMGIYNQVPHRVRRNTSQTSNLSEDMGMPSAAPDSVGFLLQTPTGQVKVNVPRQLWNKIENVSDDDQQKYVSQYLSQQQQQQQQHQVQQQQISQQPQSNLSEYQHLTKGNHMPSMESEVSARGGNSTLVQEPSFRGENCSQEVHRSNAADVNIPNLSLFDSGVMNSESPNASLQMSLNADRSDNRSSHSGSYASSSYTGTQVLQQSPGIPTVIDSLEEDSPSLPQAQGSLGNNSQTPLLVGPATEKLKSEEDSSDDEKMNQKKPKKKKSKYQKKYVTINIIQSGNVQVGDGNVVMGKQKPVEIDSSGSEGDEEEEEEIKKEEENKEDEEEVHVKKIDKKDYVMTEAASPTKMSPPVKPVMKGTTNGSPLSGKPQRSHSEMPFEGEFDAALSSVSCASSSHHQPQQAKLNNLQREEPEICTKLPEGLERLIQGKQSMPKPGNVSPNVARVPPMVQSVAPGTSDSDSETELKQVDSDQTVIKTVQSGPMRRPTQQSTGDCRNTDNDSSSKHVESSKTTSVTKQQNHTHGHNSKQNGENVSCISQNSDSTKCPQNGKPKTFGMSRYSNASWMFRPNSYQTVPFGEDPLSKDSMDQSSGFVPGSDMEPSEEQEFVIIDESELTSSSSVELSSSSDLLPKPTLRQKLFRLIKQKSK